MRFTSCVGASLLANRVMCGSELARELRDSRHVWERACSRIAQFASASLRIHKTSMLRYQRAIVLAFVRLTSLSRSRIIPPVSKSTISFNAATNNRIPMPRILLLYASIEGQTQLIAERIAHVLREKAHSVDMLPS